MDIRTKTNRVINHRIPAKNVSNVDYSIDETSNNILNILCEDCSISVQLSSADYSTFRSDISNMNSYLSLPDNVYSESSSTELNSDQSLYINTDDLIGHVVVGLESSKNAPYLLIRTEPIKSYSRVVQIYLTPAQVDKLDIDTIRDVPVVYSYQSMVTVDGTEPHILFTATSSSFVDIEVPVAMLANLKLEMQSEVDFLNDPINEQNINFRAVTEKNATSFTLDVDEVISISPGHMSIGYTPFLQIILDQSDRLRRVVMTIYMTQEMLEDLNTIIQGW